MSKRKTIWPSFVYLAIGAAFLVMPDRLNLNAVIRFFMIVLVIDLAWRLWHNWRAERRQAKS